jgi:hypothetical protein
MEVHFAPGLQAKIDQLVIETGRAPGKLDSRYDDLKSGRVKPIGGESFFEALREREDELLNKR